MPLFTFCFDYLCPRCTTGTFAHTCKHIHHVKNGHGTGRRSDRDYSTCIVCVHVCLCVCTCIVRVCLCLCHLLRYSLMTPPTLFSPSSDSSSPSSSSAPCTRNQIRSNIYEQPQHSTPTPQACARMPHKTPQLNTPTHAPPSHYHHHHRCRSCRSYPRHRQSRIYHHRRHASSKPQTLRG